MVEDRETLVPVVVSGFSNNLKSSSYGLLALRPQVTILDLLKFMLTMYRKVASRSTSRLVALPRIFRLFMKGKFDAYVL